MIWSVGYDLVSGTARMHVRMHVCTVIKGEAT